MECVHVGSPTQEPFVQNEDEDEVDAGQKVQIYICQQEGQVEALWAEERGGLRLGSSTAGRSMPQGCLVMGDNGEAEGQGPAYGSNAWPGLWDPEILVGLPCPHPHTPCKERYSPPFVPQPTLTGGLST